MTAPAPMQTIIYKCSCMASEQSFEVPYRNEDEDVGRWMTLCVNPALYLHHRQHSPLCRATKTEYLKIHMPESAPQIGARPKIN